MDGRSCLAPWLTCLSFLKALEFSLTHRRWNQPEGELGTLASKSCSCFLFSCYLCALPASTGILQWSFDHNRAWWLVLHCTELLLLQWLSVVNIQLLVCWIYKLPPAQLARIVVLLSPMWFWLGSCCGDISYLSYSYGSSSMFYGQTDYCFHLSDILTLESRRFWRFHVLASNFAPLTVCSP